MTYIATDAAGNSASCSFKLFVLRKYFTSLPSCSSPKHIIQCIYEYIPRRISGFTDHFLLTFRKHCKPSSLPDK